MYHDLAEAVEESKDKGYTHLFEVKKDCLKCDLDDSEFGIDKLHIVTSYHFDQGTDPGDDASLFLIETESGIKGYLIAGATIYKDREKAEFLDSLLKK